MSAPALGRSPAPGPWRVGSRSYAVTEAVVMGIVNRTPDSFYDKGASWAQDAALDLTDRQVSEGAGILDIGGVKAGPGDTVDVVEELRRTAGFVAAVRARHPQVAISVDTWRPEVAQVLLGEGADLVNDTWGGHEPALVDVAAAAGVGIVCAHAGGLTPRTRPHRIGYDDVVREVVSYVTALAERAVAAGVPADRIVIDPAHDFGKNSRHSLALTNRLDELVATGWPVLVALSRKDFIGETLDLPPGERLTGTLAATAVSAWQGARVFRAHDVAATRQVLDTVASIRGDRPPAVARRGLA